MPDAPATRRRYAGHHADGARPARRSGGRSQDRCRRLRDEAVRTIHLSILLFFPLALALLGALLPRGLAPAALLAGALVALAYAVLLLVDFQTGAPGLQYVTDDEWIEELGIRYTLGVDGLNLWLVGLTTLLFTASALWITLRPLGRAREALRVPHGAGRDGGAGRVLAQDLLLFVLFFDLMLVPFYFLVGQWGGPIASRRRSRSSFTRWSARC